MARSINHKQQKFIDAVSKGVGHREAAIAAGYSPKSAQVMASKLLTVAKVKTALEERQAYYRSIANVDGAEIVGAYKEMAMASIEDALDDNGNLDFVKAKQNGSAKLIKKISRQQTKYGETVAVEFYPRTEALNQLSDILGLKQAPRQNDADTTTDAIAQAFLDKGIYPDAETARAAAEGYVQELGGVG